MRAHPGRYASLRIPAMLSHLVRCRLYGREYVERRLGPDPPARIEAVLSIRRGSSLIPSETVAIDAATALDPVLRRRPIGEVIETGVSAAGLGTATYDAGRRYRYRLSRVWDPTRPRCCFVMLNPSTADALRLDPTLRRCVGFARGWACGAVEVVNVFAYRATDPAELRRAEVPVGPGNDEAILAAAGSADLVVAAWGAAAALGGRAEVVRRRLAAAGIELSALRLTRDGAPGHPLYVPAGVMPRRW